MLFRKPPPDKARVNTHELDPVALENALEAKRLEVVTSTDKPDPTTKHNLTRHERIALKELANNDEIIIKKPDKGSTIVVRSRKDYIREGLEHLSDPNIYLQLDNDRTEQVAVIIKNTLDKLKKLGLILPKMANYCMPPEKPKTALIYFLKKIHKNPMGIRPIVSTTNSATANLAKFLDIYLQPIMKALPAYLKDTTQFICEIANLTLDNNVWLVTIDVNHYTPIYPMSKGSKHATRYGFNKKPKTHTIHQLKHSNNS